MRKFYLLLVLVFSLLFTTCGCSMQTKTISTSASPESIKSGIERFIKQERKEIVTIDIQTMADTEQSRIILFTLSGQNKRDWTGYAVLKSQSDAKYTISTVNSTTNNADYFLINDETSQTLALLLYKYRSTPAKVQFEAASQTFVFDVPKAGYTILTRKLEQKVADDAFSGSVIHFSDAQGKDISDSIEKTK